MSASLPGSPWSLRLFRLRFTNYILDLPFTSVHRPPPPPIYSLLVSVVHDTLVSSHTLYIPYPI